MSLYASTFILNKFSKYGISQITLALQSSVVALTKFVLPLVFKVNFKLSFESLMLWFVSLLVSEGINGHGDGELRLLRLLLLPLHLPPEQLQLQPLLDQRLPRVLHHLPVTLQSLCLLLIMASHSPATMKTPSTGLFDTFKRKKFFEQFIN